VPIIKFGHSHDAGVGERYGLIAVLLQQPVQF
jgi:hypothetical protein